MNELVAQSGVFEIAEGMSPDKIRKQFPAASDSEIKKYIAMVFAGLKASNQGETDAAMMLEVYSMVLAGKPLFAVEAATKAFLNGHVPDASKTFAPSSAEFVSEVDRQFWLRIRFKKEPEPPKIEHSPDHKEKMIAKFDALKKTIARPVKTNGRLIAEQERGL